MKLTYETYFLKVFLKVGTIECFVTKAGIKVVEAAIHSCFLKKAERKT